MKNILFKRKTILEEVNFLLWKNFNWTFIQTSWIVFVNFTQIFVIIVLPNLTDLSKCKTRQIKFLRKAFVLEF